MRQRIETLPIDTHGRGMIDITQEIRRVLGASGLTSGLCTVFVRHTSASLLVQENADPSVRIDFERFMAKLVPDGDALFSHDDEGPDDMPAHVRSALTQTSLGIPFVDGRLVLGTWQGLYLWEHRRRPHHRSVVVHLLGE